MKGILIESVLLGYFDPNAGGVLFQVLATSFALLSGVALLFSRQIRAAFGRARRFLRSRFAGERDTGDAQADAEQPGPQGGAL